MEEGRKEAEGASKEARLNEYGLEEALSHFLANEKKEEVKGRHALSLPILFLSPSSLLLHEEIEERDRRCACRWLGCGDEDAELGKRDAPHETSLLSGCLLGPSATKPCTRIASKRRLA